MKMETYIPECGMTIKQMVRSEKTGAYVFEERMVPNDKVQDWLK